MAVQGGAMASFNMAAAMDPNMQLLLLQQQVPVDCVSWRTGALEPCTSAC